ncbi:MAG: ABC transporter permease, partial [Chloroflexi bacterium]|nr:ABC transporter permease [Chloroflexota bacterium]
LDDDIADNAAGWEETADDRLEQLDAFGVITIPEGFGAQLRANDSVTIQYKSSADLSAPTLAEQKIDAAVSRMGGTVAIANLTVDVAATHFAGLDDEDTREAAFDTALAEAEAAWQTQQPVTVNEGESDERGEAIGFNQSGPGTAVMFVLIFMLNASTVLVGEREEGTLQRLYTLPVRKWQIIAGMMVGQYAFGVLQFSILVGFGTIFGVEWGTNIPGLALLMLVYTLACAALGLALATVVRTSAQANSISLLLGLTLAPLGGAWWPLEIVPDFMKTVGHLSPVAWAMDAFNELMFYDGTVLDIAPMLSVLLVMAAVFFTFGSFNFRYE